MEKAKQEIVGKVVSASNNKTITVAVVTYKKHPLYNKNVKTTLNLKKLTKKGTYRLITFKGSGLYKACSKIVKSIVKK